MTDETKARIERAIADNRVMLFMKGSPDFPQCGFSATVVDCLEQVGAKFGAIDVLADGDVREGIKEYSQWPTLPQLYIEGEFIGGCDIVRDLFESGELKQRIEQAGAAA